MVAADTLIEREVPIRYCSFLHIRCPEKEVYGLAPLQICRGAIDTVSAADNIAQVPCGHYTV